MTMLFKLENVSVDFGEKVIFDSVNFVFNEGDKIGIIGDNSVGKTTLLNVILNKTEYTGNVVISNKNFGTLSQDDSFEEIKNFQNRKVELEKKLEDQETISNPKLYEKLLNEYTEISNLDKTDKKSKLFEKFNFNSDLYEKEIKDNLSGGETTKFRLIELFSKNYDYLIMDEPSNHLDTNSKKQLFSELSNLKSYIIISHDVELLNKCCTKIIEIKNKTLNTYHGNYDYYLEQVEKEKNETERLINEKIREKKKIKQSLEDISKWSNSKMKEKTKHLKQGQVLRDMGIGRGSMESGIVNTNKRINQLTEKINSIETPEIENNEEIKIKYINFQKPNQEVLMIKDLIKKYDDFKLKIDQLEVFANDKLGIQGDNGSGKSTLLKIISNQLLDYSGSCKLGENVQLGYLSQKNENLNLNNTILSEIQGLKLTIDEGEIRKYLGKLLFKKNDVFKKISDLSGGEKIRLAFLKLVLSGCNFLLLDEPSNYLDIKSKDILADALKDYPGAIVCVSHDDYFLDKVVNKKIEIINGEIK